MKNAYGLERVIAPAHVFPASAWELDNSRTLKSGEMRVSVKRIHIEGKYNYEDYFITGYCRYRQEG